MRDIKKFYVPKITKNPSGEDVIVKLKWGKEVPVDDKDYDNIKKFFEIKSFVGESNSQSVGYIKASSKKYDKEGVFSAETYNKIKNDFEISEIVGSIQNPSTGNIIAHNSILNLDATFSYSDWLNLNDDWDAIGIYGINTIEEENAVGGEYVIMANGTTFIINASDYPQISTQWEHVDTIALASPYVDLGLPSGTLWGIMNVGASSITDYGDYYQYGKGSSTYEETSSEAIYSGTENPLSLSLDSATQILGTGWSIPTVDQQNELSNNTTKEVTEIDGVTGTLFTSTINNNSIFIPHSGYYSTTGFVPPTSVTYLLSSTPQGPQGFAAFVVTTNGAVSVGAYSNRDGGYNIRPVYVAP